MSCEYRSLGRLKLEDEYEYASDFSIDGPGGERIETIKMRHYYPNPVANVPGSVQDAQLPDFAIPTPEAASQTPPRAPTFAFHPAHFAHFLSCTGASSRLVPYQAIDLGHIPHLSQAEARCGADEKQVDRVSGNGTVNASIEWQKCC
ncbi:hypothetical protein BT67DRAFT_454784 [Trichocladium antarcticum]|uniref:Uncharacterized protein n=1 Tax=Trichocladium antarcticum TaxID=1450529 RepID=A0AAN6UMZ5_9PEZI|nr:hypothetical protein BT67DRAFT_454784 [Trichocladium antarcticum]